MVFKRMLGAFGVGGPSVDTVLANPNTRPGLGLDGTVNLIGGSHDVTIEHVTVGLVTRVEVESGDAEYDSHIEFHRVGVAGSLRLREGERMSLPFQVPVPWETPITHVYGQYLHGMTMGLRTEVAVAGAVDKGDLDPVYVHPLVVQERILGAFGQLGFRFTGADLESGHVYGVQQRLPFYQEIAFVPPPHLAHRVNEVELTLVTSPHGVDVIVEVDKRGGFFHSGHDQIARFQVGHAGAESVDWAAQVDAWVRQAVDAHHARLGAGHHPAPGYGHVAHHGHHGHHSGVGAAVGGAAVGFAAGMVAEEVFDEVFDVFEGDDE